MIKIKILNPKKGRNEATFRPLYFIEDLLRLQYSIDITTSDDYDYMFIGLDDFYDMNKTLKDSVEWGLENIEKETKGGDYFLFDGLDSTSMAGTYEVLEQSNAIYLFKHQLLKNREDYNKVSAFGRWWFGTGSELDISYDINEKNWNRIKLSGMNLGYQLPSYHQHTDISNEKEGICAIYHGHHKPIPANKATAPGIYYTEHRVGAWDALSKLEDKYTILKNRLPKQEYLEKLWKSKLVLSPYGMGEICYRDFEAMQFGTLMVKPSMKNIDTYPNMYIENETYVPVKEDWSDLCEVVEDISTNYNKYAHIPINFRNRFKELYTYENLCMYWYNIFRNLENINED
jgi:hypothetical protein